MFFSKERERRIPSSNMPYFHYHVCGVLLQANLQYCHCEWKMQLIKKEEEKREMTTTTDTHSVSALFQALNVHQLPKELQQLNEVGTTLFSFHSIGNAIERDEVLITHPESQLESGRVNILSNCTILQTVQDLVLCLICSYNLCIIYKFYTIFFLNFRVVLAQQDLLVNLVTPAQW